MDPDRQAGTPETAAGALPIVRPESQEIGARPTGVDQIRPIRGLKVRRNGYLIREMTVVGDNLSKTYAAVPDSVPEVRRELGELATAAGATPEQVQAVRLAASEAATNVVVHAYGGHPGRLYVTAAAVLDELWILIGDDGCGMHARSDSPGLGLGLMLMSQESDDFTVLKRASGGTEVRMRFDLVATKSRPDSYVRGSEAAASRPASSRFSTTT